MARKTRRRRFRGSKRSRRIRRVKGTRRFRTYYRGGNTRYNSEGGDWQYILDTLKTTKASVGNFASQVADAVNDQANKAQEKLTGRSEPPPPPTTTTPSLSQ